MIHTKTNTILSCFLCQLSSKVESILKSTPVTGHAGPEGSSRVKAPRFLDNSIVMVVGCEPYAPAAFTPRSIPGDRKHTWYSFLLEAESTPGPKCDRQDYVMEKNPDTIGNRTRDLPVCSVMWKYIKCT